ncbi:MAG: NUDIX hydrolase [Candidatus Vecturithrix sp.]|jgi:8-oxo-dGTP pyrophosphatase MutT (NUDIX family)|nr:NUDIX hydrolase [Candidatus Vecturithrix sp.]
MKKVKCMDPTSGAWRRGGRYRKVTTVYENQWFKIRNRDNYYSLEYDSPQVVILPLVANKILMVKVNRPLIDDEPWELPAGGCNVGETPQAAARRELKEETGIWIDRLDRFEALRIVSELPGRSCELLLSFMVRVTPEEFDSRGNFEHEITAMKLMCDTEIKQAIVSGELYTSSPIAIVSSYLFALEKN